MRRLAWIDGSLAGTLLIGIVLWTGHLSMAPPAAAEPPGPPRGATEKAVFSMYCYWTGEASLGLVPGVVASRIGELGGSEVVEVEYNPARTDPGKLAASLNRHGGFYALIAPDRATAKRAEAFLPEGKIEVRASEPRWIESKYSLRTRHPELAELELTERQAIALNTWSYFGGPMPDVLSAEQKARLRGR